MRLIAARTIVIKSNCPHAIQHLAAAAAVDLSEKIEYVYLLNWQQILYWFVNHTVSLINKMNTSCLSREMFISFMHSRHFFL